VNRATVAQFDSLIGVGPVIAKRIVEYREKNGPFVDIADLQKVAGIGPKSFEKIKNRLSL
jgi:competence protein ComEA